MKVSYNWLQTYFKKSLPKPEKLAELFNAHAFEVESIEKQQNDTVLDVKVLPDRAHYALSHLGIAVEIGAIIGEKVLVKEPAKINIDTSVGKQEVRVEDKKLCRRYIARKVNGVKVGQSPKWLSERLEAIGARSINSVVDATNYVMFDIQQPLHAFDADKVKGSIIVRKAKSGEKMTLLDGREVELKDSDLLIADEEGPLVIAGVKGGKRAEVTNDTKNIIIESASFEPATVRRTSTRLNIRNDSSKRFENDLTPHVASRAIDEVTALILDIAKGSAGPVNDVYNSPVKPWTVEANMLDVNSITGLDLKVSKAKEILESLWCKVEVKGDTLSVTPPFVRQDIAIPEDIADEVGRIYGYDKLKAKQTPSVEPTPIDKTFFYTEKIKNVLVELGFSEVITYTLSLYNPNSAYSLVGDKYSLRPDNIQTFSLKNNAQNVELLGIETIKIFEIGKVFPKDGEKTNLYVAVSQIKKQKGNKLEDIIKNVVTSIENSFKNELIAPIIKISNTKDSLEVGFDAYIAKLPNPTSLKGLDFVVLPKDLKYKPFSQYPYIVRDIAFFAPKGVDETKARTLIDKAARASGGNLLIKGPDLFDKFEKGDKVSFGFRLIFQSFEKTLSDEEVNSFMEEIYKAVKEKGWEVR